MEKSVFFQYFPVGSVDLINSSTQVKPTFFDLSLGFSTGVPRGTFLIIALLARASGIVKCDRFLALEGVPA